jgi:hypothetical protein
MARIGIVQTRGIGDIVIALPIAAAFAERGDTVFWPVDAAWLDFLQPAAPYVEFLEVPSDAEPRDYFVSIPKARLKAASCDEVHVLYSGLALAGEKITNERLAQFLKFDEYKYAVAGVPFARKWELQIGRDQEREERLFDSLELGGAPYICMHRQGHGFSAQVDIVPEWRRDYRIVEIDERTGSPFDWLGTLERAAKILCIDSCFANLVEQLNFPNEKYLVLRTPGPLTPVYRNGWRFV